jgi:hypothetical protein
MVLYFGSVSSRNYVDKPTNSWQDCEKGQVVILEQVIHLDSVTDMHSVL